MSSSSNAARQKQFEELKCLFLLADTQLFAGKRHISTFEVSRLNKRNKCIFFTFNLHRKFFWSTIKFTRLHYVTEKSAKSAARWKKTFLFIYFTDIHEEIFSKWEKTRMYFIIFSYKCSHFCEALTEKYLLLLKSPIYFLRLSVSSISINIHIWCIWIINRYKSGLIWSF